MKFKNNKIEMAYDQMVQSIFELSKLEGVLFTFPQTKDIVDNELKSMKNYQNYSDDVDVVIRLKRAYKMCIRLANNNKTIISLDDILSINETLGQHGYISYGVLRNTQPDVRYGSKTYNPPEESGKLRKEWSIYLSKPKFSLNDIINQFAYIIKQQCFNDANKRTAFIVSNVLLLKNNIGFLMLDINKDRLFGELVYKYDHNIINQKLFVNEIIKHFLVKTIIKQKSENNSLKTNDYKETIQKVLNQQGLNKYKIAKLLNIDTSHIVRVLNFKKTPSIKLAKKIAKLLNIEWEIFFKD